jgi:pyruvate carboxylase
MEMNTRIQVEHPITEQVLIMTWYVNILVAAGVPISGKIIYQSCTLSNVVLMLKILIMILDRLQEK